jgi:5'-deoxynucleotidase YfbR-like HD superfamily hydrolase
LVRDADKLEMMVQCLRYEEAGSRGLDEFWQAMDHHRWHYALSARLYERLRARRQIRDLAGASCAPGAGLSDRLRDRRLGSLTHDV